MENKILVIDLHAIRQLAVAAENVNRGDTACLVINLTVSDTNPDYVRIENFRSAGDDTLQRIRYSKAK